MRALHRNPSRTGDGASSPGTAPATGPGSGDPTSAAPASDAPVGAAPDTTPAAGPETPAATGGGFTPLPREPAAGPATIAWVSVIVAAVLGVVTVIILLQNEASTHVTFLWFHADVPLAVALLISFLVGVGIALIAGGARMLELRRRRSGR